MQTARRWPSARVLFATLLLFFGNSVQGMTALASDVSEYFPKGTFFAVEEEFRQKLFNKKRSKKSESEFRKEFADFNESYDKFQRDRYNKSLAALEEPVLSECGKASDVYRLTWLRSFHNPMSFRLQIGTVWPAKLVVKRANGKGGFEPGHLVFDETFAFSEEWTTQLLNRLHRLNVVQMPTTNLSFGLDGARWILEMCEAGSYHVVDRHGGGEIGGWALDLMKAPGIDLGKIY